MLKEGRKTDRKRKEGRKEYASTPDRQTDEIRKVEKGRKKEIKGEREG